MKKAVKAKKSVKKAAKAAAKKTSKKAAKKKAVTKKATKKKAVKKKAKAKKAKPTVMGIAPLGCCTLTGSGPDDQFEGVTQARCRELAIAAGKNDHWVLGQCAEPN